MAGYVESEWRVTEDKVAEAIRRLVAVSDPLAVVAFGSRVRREHRPDSDLDLAVILDVPESEAMDVIPGDIFKGMKLLVDLLPVAKERYERFRPWINSVHRQLDEEGIWLYERGAGSPSPDLIHQVC